MRAGVFDPLSAMAAERPVLRAITGCTATGKTEWALRWAEARGAEIVSCDSLLFYRGMDIGTAKPTPGELARVRHHLIDVCDVTEQMDITRYVKLARAALGEIAARGREARVVGGGGVCLKASAAPIADDVDVPPETRAEVASLSLAEALNWLRRLNPQGLGALDVAKPRRVTRALERCLVSGRPLVELAEAFARQPSPFADWRVEITRIEREPEELQRRIELRVAAMLNAGLVEEVKRLLGAGLKENPSAARAIGYREVIAMLDGKLAPAALAGEIAKNTRALVKKQRTWFRTQLPEHSVVAAETLREPGELFS